MDINLTSEQLDEWMTDGWIDIKLGNHSIYMEIDMDNKPSYFRITHGKDVYDGIGVLSAQPEIIRCKECKHYQGEDSWLHCNRVTWLNGEDDFCSRAERSTE